MAQAPDANDRRSEVATMRRPVSARPFDASDDDARPPIRHSHSRIEVRETVFGERVDASTER
jgi:hypothetical protein